MENKEPKKEEKVFNPFAILILPCVIIFTLYKAHDRYSERDMDSALMYFIASLAFGFAIYFFTKKKKDN